MPLPDSLQAIEIETGSEALKLVERVMPKPADHQVLIKVAAAGINRPDIMQR